MSSKIQWIDIAKGIGIILVVVAHIINPSIARYIFWFHMPFFFFISGYLYKMQPNYWFFFKKKSLHFIVPYISFLILLSLPEYLDFFLQLLQPHDSTLIHKILQKTFDKIYGGRNLYGEFGVFWFITCLFFTQQLYNFLYCKFYHQEKKQYLFPVIILIAYLLAMADYWLLKGISFPWNINVVAMALPFYYLGHIAAKLTFDYRKLFLVSVIFFILMVSLNYAFHLNLVFDMKNKNYGIILLNLITALSGIIIIINFARIAEKFSLLKNPLIQIGNASLIIMYLHQKIQLDLRHYSPLSHEFYRIIIGIIVPFFTYLIVLNYSSTRKLFLGDFSEK